MSNPKWLEKYLKMKPDVEQIFDDLDQYRAFCVEHGHPFDEAKLYKEYGPWGEFQRKIGGKGWARDMWYWKPRDPNKPRFEKREGGWNNRNNNR
jgi:hypothetical protein